MEIDPIGETAAITLIDGSGNKVAGNGSFQGKIL
jgi:hypothetical protein